MKLLESNGLKLFVREEQPAYDDVFVVEEVIDQNTYRIKPEWFKGNTIIDIGANIGAFTILAAQYGHVLAYEPEPHNFAILQANVAINGSNAEIFNVALGGSRKTTFINNASGHSQVDWPDPGKTETEVEVITLNDVPFTRCDLLKMDCEGGEYDMIKYATDKTLSKIDRIVGELHSWRWESNPQEHQQLIGRLEQFFNLTYWGFKDGTFMGVAR